MSESQAQSQRPAAERTSKLEWIVAALGGLLLASTLAYMIYDGLARPDGPPEITVSTTSSKPSADGVWLIEVVARNEGRSTAAQVLVAASLREGEETIEESEATIDYLPTHSERKAGFYFTQDPSAYDVELRVKGYSEP